MSITKIQASLPPELIAISYLSLGSLNMRNLSNIHAVIDTLGVIDAMMPRSPFSKEGRAEMAVESINYLGRESERVSE